MSRYFLYYTIGAVSSGISDGFFSYRFYSDYKKRLPDNYLSQAAKFAAQDCLVWPATCVLTFSRLAALTSRKVFIDPKMEISLELYKHQCPPLPPSIPRLAAYNRKIIDY